MTSPKPRAGNMSQFAGPGRVQVQTIEKARFGSRLGSWSYNFNHREV